MALRLGIVPRLLLATSMVLPLAVVGVPTASHTVAVSSVTATPTPAPAPPTDPNASPPPDITGTGGAAVLDLTPLWIGGAIVLGLLVGFVIAAVRRARGEPGRR